MAHIVKALEEAVRAHPESAICGLTTMLGVLFGAILGFVGGIALEWWKSRGQIACEVLAVVMRGSPDWAEAQQLAYEASVRVLNTYPADRSLAVAGVTFHRRRPRWWSREAPILNDPYPRCGYQWRATDKATDLHLPAGKFTRIYLAGASIWTSEPAHDPKMTELVKSARFMCIDLRISPKGKHKLCYDLRGAIDREDQKNESLLRDMGYHDG